MTDQKDPRIKQLAEKLRQAGNSGKEIDAPSKEYPDLTIQEAYAIQLHNIAERENNGSRIVGKKIGLTSKAMQESLGVDEPDYGILLEDMQIASTDPVISTDQVIQPRVEGELAFILKKDLEGPNVTVSDVLDATESVAASIEIVDSRVKDWKIGIRDTVADNASSAFYVLGDERLDPKDAKRIEVEMALYKNGELINEGTGADVLGDPAYCVAWLANKLHEYDIKLKAGEVILAGALSAAISAEPGDQFTCKFTEGFGSVSVNFEK
ncbi:MAG: 2-keto-4-pentenoate hydratase [Alkalibacterium sp.]